MFIFVSSILVALIVSFMCSVMEAALLSVTPSQIADISERHPRIGKICRRFKVDIEKPIAVILILNTSAHTIGAAVAGAQFDELFGGEWIWLFSLIFTLVMVQYTEILPKTLGVRFNRGVITATARPLRFLVWLLQPLIVLVHLINRPFSKPENHRNDVSGVAVKEIAALATVARRAHRINFLQEHMIKLAPELDSRTVGEIMLPFESISFIREDMTRSEILARIAKEKHTRYPVAAANDPRRIVGYFNVKELLFMERKDGENDWHSIIRTIGFTDRDEPVLDILENISRLDAKLVMVLDREDGIVGMLTITDVMRELIGKKPVSVIN